MDDIFRQALAKWPNVPHCYGWLGLDARGNWYMRDDRTQATGPFPAAKGSLLQHEKLIDFIQRNYEHDDAASGSSRTAHSAIYVELEATPLATWRVGAASAVDGAYEKTDRRGHGPACSTKHGHLYLVRRGHRSRRSWSIRRTWASRPMRSSRGGGRPRHARRRGVAGALRARAEPGRTPCRTGLSCYLKRRANIEKAGAKPAFCWKTRRAGRGPLPNVLAGAGRGAAGCRAQAAGAAAARSRHRPGLPPPDARAPGTWRRPWALAM